MKLLGVFRFELGYQLRRVSTWLYFAALVFFAFVQIPGELASARNGEYFVGAPFVVASVTIMGCLAWLVVAAAIAGNAAARDVATRMDALTYTAPVSKGEYLGGRFLAAFVLNALILIAVPLGTLLGVYGPEAEAEIRGPFLPMAYLTAYGFIAVPIAFVVTAVQFSFSALSRRAITSYLAGILLLVGMQVVGMARSLSRDLRQLLDPLGVIAITRDDLTVGWTQIELNTRLIAMESGPLANRLLWVGVAVGLLAFTHYRFRFHHPTASSWWRRIARRGDAHATAPAGTGIAISTPSSSTGATGVPHVPPTFGLVTRMRQALAIAWPAFRTIATSWSGLIFAAAITLLGFVMVLDGFMRVPLLLRSEHVLVALITPQAGPFPWILIPLLIVFWAGELLWREREAGLSEIADAMPVPEWVVFLGKFLGLSLLPVAFMALFMAIGIFVQVMNGSPDIEIGLYLQVLFGLQLADYVQLSLFALAMQVVVNQKPVGQLVALLSLFFMMIAYASELGHALLVPIFDPGWSYTDMLGFGPSLGPWLWLKLYWIAWVLLLAIAARLLWVRGQDGGLGERLRIARRRFTGPTAATAAVVVVLILTSGGFIFYNTNVLNEPSTASDTPEHRAEYERRLGQYQGVPQPRLTETDLRVEIYPARQEVQIRGTYGLVNSSMEAIDSVHLATVPDVDTAGVVFDRPAELAFADEQMGHRIYALEEQLEPGDSLRVSFVVEVALREFSNHSVDTPVTANSTFFTNQAWLPAIGYQRTREISNNNVRRAHGLEPRPELLSPYDVEAQQPTTGPERIAFEAVVGTDEDQVAVAPGTLRRTWTEGGRRYFQYSTDAPIGNEYAFSSSNYAVHEAQWNDVAIQIFHHPGHTANLDRMVRSVQASLDYNTTHFGPSARGYIRLIERPGHAFGLHAEDDTIFYGEAFSLLNPDEDSRGFDLVFATVAHEVGHGWGIPYTRVAGAGLLSESFAWYAAMGTLREGYGRDHLRRLLGWMREPAPFPPVRATVPLLRSNNAYLSYRKGPLALYALSEYVGEERVNAAFRRLREEHSSAAAPRATSLDLYRELQAVTPDSLQTLLHDLFEANTFWELETERATTEQTEAGTWQVTLDVRARKLVVDAEGVETPVPMDDWVEIGVFAPADPGEESGEPLYLQRHHIRSARETITVTVPSRPALAGIDPRHLLVDLDTDDNVEQVTLER